MSIAALGLVFASSGHISPLIPLAMVVIGILLFIFGFVKYRQFRVLADTPRVPIRSVSMGLSHVAGTSVGGQPLTSPLTQIPCYYFEVKVEKQVKRDNQETWEQTHHEKAEVPFYLQDETGTILVNPQQAEYNLPQAFWGELRPPALISLGHAPRKVDPSLGIAPPTDDHLRAYLNSSLNQLRAAVQGSGVAGAGVVDKGLAVAQKMQMMGVSIGAGGVSFDFGNHAYRFTEFVLPAGRPTNVLGTCVENPQQANEGDRNMIKKGQNEKTFLISTKTEEKLEGSMKMQAFVMIFLGAVLILGGAALGLYTARML